MIKKESTKIISWLNSNKSNGEIFQLNLEVFKHSLGFIKVERNLFYSFTDLAILYGVEVCENYLNWLLKRWWLNMPKYKKFIKIHSVWAHKQVISSNYRINKTFRVLHVSRWTKVLKNNIIENGITLRKNMIAFKNCIRIKKKSVAKIKMKRESLIKIHISTFNSKISNSSNNLEHKIVFLKDSTLCSLAGEISCLLKMCPTKRSCFLINETCYTSLKDYLFFKNTFKFRENRTGMNYYFVKSLNVRLSTLRFIVGGTYLYVHEGFCQHEIVFNNVTFVKSLNDKKIV